MMRIRHLFTAALLLAPSLAFGQAPGQPVASGPVGVVALPVPLPVPPTTLAPGASWSTPITFVGVWSDIVCAVSGPQSALTLTLTRYVDAAGIQIQDQHTTTNSSQTWASLAIVDGIPFTSYMVTVQNTSGAPANIASFNAFVVRRDRMP